MGKQIGMWKIQKYMPNNYTTLKKWFKDWDNWTPCSESSIPQESSFMYYENEIPKAFMCYYKTNSDIAVMGFTIKDREFKDSDRALDYLFNTIKEDAKSAGFNIIYYSTDNVSKHFVDKFVQHGGVVTDNADAYIACMKLSDNINIDFFECKE